MAELKTRLATQDDVNFASQISRWTIESGTMLPKPEDELLDLFRKNNSVLVFDERGELVSHAAITFVYSDNSVEIGCVITDKEKRKNGAAKQALKEVLTLANHRYPNNMKFALCNEYSYEMFEKVGAVKMSSSELSVEVWIPCKTCPRLPIQELGKPFKCCDTPYNLTHIK